MTVIYLVRHGQSQANAKGIWQGAQIDTPLTELGRTQAQNTKKHLEEDPCFVPEKRPGSLLQIKTLRLIRGLKNSITACGTACIGKTSLKDTVNFSMLQKIFFRIHGKLPA